MRYLICFLLLTSTYIVKGQTVNVDDSSSQLSSMTVLNGVNGEPVFNPKYTRIIEGSLFVPAAFTKSLVFIKNNKRPISVQSRINIPEERVHFINDRGAEQYSTSQIEEIQFLQDDKYRLVYVFGIPGCDMQAKAWYEVVEKGKLNLYRMVTKNVQEVKTYGSATTDQKIFDVYSYWIQHNNNCQQIRKITEFASYLQRSNPAMNEKLPSRKLSDKKEADWIELAKIFNAL